MRHHSARTNHEPTTPIVNFNHLTHSPTHPFAHTPVRVWVEYASMNDRMQPPAGSEHGECTVYVWVPVYPPSDPTARRAKRHTGSSSAIPQMQTCDGRDQAETVLASYGQALPKDFDTVLVHDQKMVWREHHEQESDTQKRDTQEGKQDSKQDDAQRATLLPNATYVLVFEPSLQCLPLSALAFRMSTVTGREHVQPAMYVPLSGESDAVWYAQQLVDTVFDVVGAEETRTVRRWKTLGVNLDHCTHVFRDNHKRDLLAKVTDATANKDAGADKDDLVQYIQNVMLHSTLPVAQRLMCGVAGSSNDTNDTDESTTLPHLSLAYTDTSFGFVADTSSDRYPCDLLGTDVPASFTCVSTRSHSNALQRPEYQRFQRYYESLVVPLLDDPERYRRKSVPRRALDTQAYTSVDELEFVTALNRRAYPLLLSQIYHQWEPSVNVPIIALWYKDPALQRQMLCCQMHYTIDSLYEVHHQNLLPYVAYQKEMQSRKSSFKLDVQHPKHLAHFMDIVVQVRHTAYVVTFDQKGVVRCVVKGFEMGTLKRTNHTSRSSRSSLSSLSSRTSAITSSATATTSSSTTSTPSTSSPPRSPIMSTPSSRSSTET